MPSQTDLRQDITSRLIKALRSGVRPWACPWSTDPNSGSPKNVVSKNGYRGINPLVLEVAALDNGFTSRWWATYKQWRELGGRVRKGQKGTRIVFWKRVDKKEIDPVTGKPERFFFMKSYSVFNLDQVDGEKLDHMRPAPANEDEPVAFVDWQPAEEALSSCNADERFGGDKAYYSPMHDFVQVPNRNRFPLQVDWYSTRFHEYGHWACDRRRLNLEPPNGADKKAAYAFEELVVEIGACFLAAELGVPSSDDTANHESYLASWLKHLEDDPKWVFQASSAASRVVDHILSYSQVDEVSTAEAVESCSVHQKA